MQNVNRLLIERHKIRPNNDLVIKANFSFPICIYVSNFFGCKIYETRYKYEIKRTHSFRKSSWKEIAKSFCIYLSRPTSAFQPSLYPALLSLLFASNNFFNYQDPKYVNLNLNNIYKKEYRPVNNSINNSIFN